MKLKSYNGENKPQTFERLNELINQGPFHIELSRTYPLEKTADALRDVTQHHIGKLAIRIKAA